MTKLKVIYLLENNLAESFLAGMWVDILTFLVTLWRALFGKKEIIELISCQLSTFFSEKGINDSTITFAIAKTKSKQKRAKQGCWQYLRIAPAGSAGWWNLLFKQKTSLISKRENNVITSWECAKSLFLIHYTTSRTSSYWTAMSSFFWTSGQHEAGGFFRPWFFIIYKIHIKIYLMMGQTLFWVH